jgi:hypothetical protein
LRADELNELYAEVPFDGLEAHYRSYTVDDTRLYRSWAQENERVVSAGSDSHWPRFPVDPIPYKAVWIRDLLQRLGIPVEEAEGAAWVPQRAVSASAA